MEAALIHPGLKKSKGKKIETKFLNEVMSLDKRILRVKALSVHDRCIAIKYLIDNLRAVGEHVWPSDPIRELLEVKDFVIAPRALISPPNFRLQSLMSRDGRKMPGVQDHIYVTRNQETLTLTLNGVSTELTEADLLP